MIDYLKYFFTPRHLFSLRPPAMHQRAIIISLVIFGCLILAGIIFNVLAKKNKDVLKAKELKKLFHLFLTGGILGLVYLFFAWQGVALLSARFWLIILLLVMIVWLVFILKYLLINAPKQRREIERKRQFEKYLP